LLLKDKICIVTGGAKGIGKAIAFNFALEGAKVVLFDIDSKKCIEAAENISVSTGMETIPVSGDVSLKNDVNNLVIKTMKLFGRIDVLVNNAGIWEGSPLTLMDEKTWDSVFSVNVKGVFLCSKAIAKEMIAKRVGTIVNIASIAGRGSGVSGWGAYCSSKAAVIMFTKVLAKELQKYNIKVYVLCPGAVDTDLFKKIKKFRNFEDVVKPKEIASIVTLLSSSLATEIASGKVLNGPANIKSKKLKKLLSIYS
jgi:NAD(P)-dependent dehydrogenase (short-subunit alcohol dehydrogenase family)